MLELPPPGEHKPDRSASPTQIYDWVVDKLPRRKRYPVYRESLRPRAAGLSRGRARARGEIGAAVRSDPATGGLVLTVAVPVQRYKEVLGAVMLSTGSGEIEQAVRAVRLELLQDLRRRALVTVLLSLYLAGTIARPIRRLAAAAERVRAADGARVEIPDFTQRGDEIGDLSGALREMTDALWQRMNAIERFAADVAHEIKNPLTSLSSAVETAVRVEDPAKQRRLMAIMLDDVERLDRLITDISDASRLDAELSARRAGAGRYRARCWTRWSTSTRRPQPEDAPRLVLDLPERGRRRLDRAGDREPAGRRCSATSSPTPSRSARRDGEIRLTARRGGRAVLVTVEDSGPGIPDEQARRDLRPLLQRAPGRREIRHPFRPRPVDLQADRRGASRHDLGREPQRPPVGDASPAPAFASGCRRRR